MSTIVPSDTALLSLTTHGLDSASCPDLRQAAHTTFKSFLLWDPQRPLFCPPRRNQEKKLRLK